MQTRCPHCKTQFHLNEDQLYVADGLVRCGVCDEIFNALDDDPDSNPTTESLAENCDEFNPESINDNHTDLPKETTAEDNPAISDDKVDANIAETEAEFDLFQPDEEDNFSDNSVVPDKYRDDHRRHSSTVISSLLWSLAILFLGFTLIIEYIWFNRNQLAQLPEAQPWIKQICQHINCTRANLHNPAQIELLARNIYSQPHQKQTLLVSVTLVNHASYAQPYPDMQIDFSDIRGRVVAARRFTPKEYLPISQNAHQLLPPELPVSFTMAIQDPGKQAMTYEFNFL